MNESEQPSPTFAAALELFNAGRYLASHELFEELWEGTQGEDSDFYKGLIQATVALHHLQEGRIEGARKLYAGHRRFLAHYLPTHKGLDLATFLEEMQRCFGEAARSVPAAQLLADPAARPRLRRLEGG